MTTDNQQAPVVGEVAAPLSYLQKWAEEDPCEITRKQIKRTVGMPESISAQNGALKRWVNEWEQTAERAEALCEAAEQRADRLQAQVFEAQGEITNLQSHLLALGADSYFAMYGWNVVDGKDEAGEPFTIEHAVAAIREEQARGRKASAEAGRLQAELDEMEETWLTTNRARGS